MHRIRSFNLLHLFRVYIRPEITREVYVDSIIFVVSLLGCMTIQHLQVEMVVVLLATVASLFLLLLLVVMVACVPQNASTHNSGGHLFLQLLPAPLLLLVRNVAAVGQVLNLHKWMFNVQNPSFTQVESSCRSSDVLFYLRQTCPVIPT